MKAVNIDINAANDACKHSQPSKTAVEPSASAAHKDDNAFPRTETINKLADIESAHACPSGRIKMEELFRQWLSIAGTKEMIHALIEDVRNGKQVWEQQSSVPVSNAGSLSPTHHYIPEGLHALHSPSRSPKLPPNPHQSHSPTGSNSRKRPSSLSLFTDDFLLDQPMPAASIGSGDHRNAMSEEALATDKSTVEDCEIDEIENLCEDDVLGDSVQEDDIVMNESNSDSGTTSAENNSSYTHVPRFYIPGKGPRRRVNTAVKEMSQQISKQIRVIFSDYPQGMKKKEAAVLTKEICNFPSFFNSALFRRVLQHGMLPAAEETLDNEDDDDERCITEEMFVAHWEREMAPYDQTERFFRLIKQPHKTYMSREDFIPFLHELLKYHPGLDFLAGTPEFQDKYALTVIARIFYSVDRDSSGQITLRKLRRSNLLEAFRLVDEEGDINKVHSYFSYEHFYVLYCKFWELDTDHDFALCADDLVRYGGHALTRIIIDRVFHYGRRPFARMQTLSTEEKKKMSYEDFIYFMLSEEDKSNPISLRYWFDLIDICEDGVIRADEMRVFYRHQVHRMECLGHDIIPFEDILCQLSDLLHPQIDGEFTYSDFTRPDTMRTAGVFFNVLFNLNKFVEFEQRDPFLLRQIMAEPELSDWDRYARTEYARLAMEEEGREEDNAMDIDSIDGWYVSETQDEDVELLYSETDDKSLEKMAT